jgi:hypothetical protein
MGGETQTHFFLPLLGYGDNPRLFFAVAGIRVESQTIFCCCRNKGETPLLEYRGNPVCLLPLLDKDGEMAIGRT